MSRNMEQLGRTIRRAESKGPVRFVTGVTTSAAASGRISVMVAGKVVPAVIPGSFRAALAVGQDIRLSVQGSTYTVDSVLSALSTPTVAAPPSASTVSPLTVSATPGFSAAGYSSSGFTSADFEAMNYVEQVILNDLNDHRDVINDHEGTIRSLKATINAQNETIADLKAALVAQGHVA